MPFKISYLMMRLIHKSLPTNDIITKFGFTCPSMYSCCRTPKSKTIDHIFLESESALATLKFFGNYLRILYTGNLRRLLFKWWLTKGKNKVIDSYFKSYLVSFAGNCGKEEVHLDLERE